MVGSYFKLINSQYTQGPPLGPELPSFPNSFIFQFLERKMNDFDSRGGVFLIRTL